MLIRFAVVPAFQFLLESQKIVQLDPFQLWPILDHSESSLNKCFVETFYSNLTEGIYNFPFKSGNISIHLSQCIFLDPDVREKNVIGDVASKVLEIESEQTFVDLPRPIFELLKNENENEMKRRTITSTTFVLQFFLPKLDSLPSDVSQNDRDCTLCYAIDLDNQDINSWLTKNKCIPVDSGALKEPAQIVDPLSKLARMFFKSEGFLLKNEFVENDIHGKLILLGMRTEELSDDMVLERANSIVDNITGCGACVTNQSLYLLSYICENIDKHIGIFRLLKELPFLPVMCKPSEWPFRWQADKEFEESTQLQKRTTCNSHGESDEPVILEKPKHLYTCDSIDVVSCIGLIVNNKFCERLEEEERLSRVTLKKLFEYLGMGSVTDSSQFVDKVVRQLMIISEVYNNGPRTDAMEEVTNRIIKSIYEFLERNSNTIPFSQAEILKDQPVVWVNSSFVSPDKVSHDKALYGCEPYLYSLCNSEIARCPTFCLSLQISDNFCARDIAEVLEKIATDNCKTPCTEKQLTACLNLLKHLLNCFEREKIKSIQTFLSDEQTVAAVYVPDENGILTDSSKLCLNDSDVIGKTASMIFIHELVPQTLAQALDIKSKKLHQLEETTEDVVDFYQEETLCSRLRRLVDGLSYDTGIFKELIQNADDAGATEVVFIKDFTNYPTEHILDEKFAPLQGLALCVYNNSSFTREDLEGIKRLGMGSKVEDPSKIGKYGVGFNAVYNITDAPSFYTTGEEIEHGETLCIFDPLAQYVPNVFKNKPGKRYKHLNSLRESHADVLKGYHERKFFQQKGNGTLFRFPLRNESSEIKKNIISFPELSDLLEKFCDELKFSMLFLKNLKKVAVFSFENDKYTEDYSIEMKLSDEDSHKRCQFADSHTTMCESFGSEMKAVFDIEQKSFAYMVTLRETLSDRCSSSSYNVVQTIGFHKKIEIPTLVKEAYMTGNIAQLPQGGIAVATEKEKNGYHGEAFCFLPLQVNTGLPVHINGHFMLDHETRRSLWLSNYMDSCFRTHWNLTIINHVVAKAYTIHLEIWKSLLFQGSSKVMKLSSEVNSALQKFFSHFPVYEQASGFYWKELTRNVYSQLSAEHFQFLPCCSQVSTEADEHDDLPRFTLSLIPLTSEGDVFPVYYYEKVIQEKVPTLDAILRSLGMKISCVPDEIRDSLKHNQQAIDELKPCHVIDYLSTFDMSTLDKDYVARPVVFVDMHVSQTTFLNESNLRYVFEYCLKDIKYFYERLTELPICMTQDGVLRKINAPNSLFVTHYTEFFPERLGQFLHKCLSEEVINADVRNNEENKEEKDFVEMSNQLFRQFTVHEFNDLTVTDGLFETNLEVQAQLGQVCQSKELLKRFWNFFAQQLPAHKNEDSMRIVRENLDVINSLKLIPAKEPASGVSVLVAPTDIDLLIGLDTFHKGTKLYNIVEKFGIAQLDETVFNCDLQSQTFTNVSQTTKKPYIQPYKLLAEQIPTFCKPEEIIRCLSKNTCKVGKTILNIDEAGVILKYFSDHVSLLQSEQELENLKKLPVFVLQTEEIMPINYFCRAVVVPKVLPKSGIAAIMDASNVALLQDLDIDDLYDRLHINHIPVEKVYTDIIFPFHQVIYRNEFYSHVELICKLTRSEMIQDPENLLLTLKALHFIDVGTYKLVRVKDLFYDHPYRKIFFQHFCKKWEMLPNCFHKSHFTEEFDKLGLQSDMTLNLFERFATDIEDDGNVSDPKDKRSELLVDRLFKMGPKFFHKNNFYRFSRIKFLKPAVVEGYLESIHEQFNSTSLICFADSIPYEQRRICWTTSNILTMRDDPNQQNVVELIQKLCIRWQPDIDIVIKHCEHIGRKLNEKLSTHKVTKDTVAKVMGNIYTALDKSSGKLYNFETLKYVPTIYFPAKNTVTIASAVVIDCKASEEIVPYVQTSPTHFGQFESLFVRLGAHRQPSIDMYVEIINKIKHDSTEKAILPAEKDTIVKAMVNIFVQLRKWQSEKPFKPDMLYFLSDETVLTEARLLVIDNNRYLRNRLKRGMKLNYLATFDDYQEISLRMDEIIDCLKNVHECSHPSLLTDLVQEQVDMDNVVWKDSDEADAIENFIHHELFITSFCRLARHGIKNRLQRQWDEEIEKEMTECISKIRLKHVEGIYTNLVVHTDVIENTRESKKVQISIEKNRTTVYFETSENNTWYIDVTNVIVLHLKNVHGCLMDELLFTAQKLLRCKDPEKCEEILDRDGIEAYKCKTVISRVAEDITKEPEREPYHDFAQAERWQRQAKCDLDSAVASLTKPTTVHCNWVCYEAHQAAEKSLKAAWLAKDAHRLELVGDTHCLGTIAEGLSNTLETSARNLSAVTGWHTRMRYPDKVPMPKIPSEYFSRNDAEHVTNIAHDILAEVQKMILAQNEM